MIGGALHRASVALAPAMVLTTITACLYSPPPQLPSSVRILYSKQDVDSTGASTDIYFIVAKKGNELRLTGEDGVDSQPFFAPGLRRVYFTRRPAAGRDEIWSMDLDGNDERRMLGDDAADYRDPAVGPVDHELAYTETRGGRSQVMIADADGGNPRALASDGRSFGEPAWSPDGRTLAVVGQEGGRARIFLIDVAGGAPRPLTSGGGEAQSHPDWSPDGTRIAFTRGAGKAAEIAVAVVAGGAVSRLTDNDVEDRDPAWSTTGERIAFVSRRPDGKENLWLVDPDGDNLTNLTDYDEDEARDPDWL